MDRVRLRLAAAVLVTLAACGTGAKHDAVKAHGGTTTTASTAVALTTTTTVAPATATTRAKAATTTTAAPHTGTTHMVGDADNGHTVSVARGDRVVVTLNSTYWKIDGGNNAAVLRRDGDTTYAPSGDCVPGGGCGTATASFTALSVGQARISASRTSCGEAMGCTGGAGSYYVDVNVS